MIRSYLRNLVEGPIAPQLRKFVVVGTVASGVQLAFLWFFVEYGGLNYLLAAAISIEITILLQYVLNNRWTFAAMKNVGRTDFLSGLVKTNVVRGSAIPIQLAILFALVAWGSVPYLYANAIAIVLTGIYRFVFDARWTWGGT
ncbi:MAG: GtrA family protein [Halobacteriota archaeon]